MLDSIPAPGADFSSSIWLLKMSKKNKAPRPSPNLSPFIFSIKLIYYTRVDGPLSPTYPGTMIPTLTKEKNYYKNFINTENRKLSIIKVEKLY